MTCILPPLSDSHQMNQLESIGTSTKCLLKLKYYSCHHRRLHSALHALSMDSNLLRHIDDKIILAVS